MRCKCTKIVHERRWEKIHRLGSRGGETLAYERRGR
jgi:hypothetical protein